LIFSEEGSFIINNWSTIEKLLNSVKILRAELAELLNSLEEELKERDWWSEGLIFTRSSSTGVYISTEQWTTEDRKIIWIGIENFTLETLFGNERPPQCYLWVAGAKEKAKITNDLGEIFINDPHLRDYYPGKSGSYILIKPIKKQVNISDDQLNDLIKEEVAEFIEKAYLAIKDYKLEL